MKPTNRLVIVVVIMSLIIALSVAGTAIALIWTRAVSEKEQDIENIAAMIRSSVEFFSSEQASLQAV